MTSHCMCGTTQTRIFRQLQFRMKTPWFPSPTSHVLPSTPCHSCFPFAWLLLPHYPVPNATPHFSCRHHADHLSTIGPCHYVHGTSKTLSFHIAHIVHLTFSLERTFTVYRYNPDSFRTFPFFPFYPTSCPPFLNFSFHLRLPPSYIATPSPPSLPMRSLSFMSTIQ